MTATETRPETAGGHVDRSDVLRSAAAIVAGGVALTSQNGILAQAGEQARAVDERFFPGFKTEKVATRFSVFGHDRGARVAHRLALDHPDKVERAALLDIIPTHYLFPVLVLWGERGSVARRYDALAIWGERAARVSGKQMPGGHSFQESHPKETAAELRSFLAA